MLITDTIKIRVNPNSRNHFNSLGYSCNNYDEIEIKASDLPPGSSIKVDVSCDICSDNRNILYNKYIKNTKSNTQIYTCKKCSGVKVKSTKLQKYGNENYSNKEKAKITKLRKYGNENYTNREKAKTTCIEKYGVENVSQIEEVKNSKIQTSVINWNVSNPFMSDVVKEKISKSVLERWGSHHYLTSDDCKEKYNKFCDEFGVDHYSKSTEFKKKYETTCLKNWGVKTSLSSGEIRQKIKNTLLNKYGFDHPMKSKEISKINTKSLVDGRKDYFNSIGYELISYDYDNCIYTLKKVECGHIFSLNYDLFRSRIKYKNSSCLECYPKSELTSIKERELYEFISSNCEQEVLSSDRTTLSGLELDIYVPSKGLAFEFNGLYWHSDKFKDKFYHQNKTNKCRELNINLFHIWEDDWMYKKDIVKSMILNKLGKNINKIPARKCKLIILDNKISNDFLKNNHIQGEVNAIFCLGLEYGSELVSVMTFGKRSINSKSNFELLRFCNKLNTSVVGGASKLFKFFILNYHQYDTIISYSDNSIYSGEMYNTLGFKNEGITSLNYYWTDLNKKYHRFNFNKKRLVKVGYDPSKTEEEIMKENGYFKIWSCGQIRWIYNK